MGRFRKGNIPWNKGVPHSLESIEKMRLANAGKHRNPETEFQKGSIPWNKGIQHRPETIAKLKGRHTNPKTEFKAGHRPTEETRKKQSESAKRRFSDPAEREKQSKRKTGKKSPVHSARMKKRWQEESYVERQKLARDMKPNKAELTLGDLLGRLFINEYRYVGDFSFFLGGRCPDFMNVNGQKKLIELYGDYYHDQEIFPDTMTPEERISHFKDYGFNTLIVWEKELNDEPQLIEKLQAFHGG